MSRPRVSSFALTSYRNTHSRSPDAGSVGAQTSTLSNEGTSGATTASVTAAAAGGGAGSTSNAASGPSNAAAPAASSKATEAAIEDAMENQELEQDVVNSNTVMFSIVNCLDRLAELRKLTQQDAQDTRMPRWQQNMLSKISDSHTHVNVRAFIAKVIQLFYFPHLCFQTNLFFFARRIKIVMNRRKMFEPFAARWISPLAAVGALPDFGTV